MTRDEQLIRAALEMAAAEAEECDTCAVCGDCFVASAAIRTIDPAEVLAKVPPAWQPIETAPRDGTLFWMWLFEPDQVRIVQFKEHSDDEQYCWNDPERGVSWNTRHAHKWMPLPTPPDRDD